MVKRRKELKVVFPQGCNSERIERNHYFHLFLWPGADEKEVRVVVTLRHVFGLTFPAGSRKCLGVGFWRKK